MIHLRITSKIIRDRSVSVRAHCRHYQNRICICRKNQESYVPREREASSYMFSTEGLTIGPKVGDKSTPSSHESTLDISTPVIQGADPEATRLLYKKRTLYPTN